MLAVIMAVSVFAVVIPGTASELSNTPATAEQTEKIGIEELQQRIYDQGYNYTVAKNWVTYFSLEDREALNGYKHLPAGPRVGPLVGDDADSGPDTIEELQQRIYDQGYNYTVTENWITYLSPEDREALNGYKHLPAGPRVGPRVGDDADEERETPPNNYKHLPAGPRVGPRVGDDADEERETPPNNYKHLPEGPLVGPLVGANADFEPDTIEELQQRIYDQG